MTDIETNPLTAITSQAKAKWKKNIKEQKRSKHKLNKSKKDTKNSKTEPPLKKRKLSHTKTHKKKGRIDFNLPLQEQKKRSVIKLENMPTGLEETQIETFFSQFGNVTRYVLKRQRYGRSLRHGYVEFSDPEVANIVVNALDSTSMYGQMLICKEIPPEYVDGATMFKTNTIHDARRHKKLDNDKRRWINIANIANLEFQFDDWHQRLISEENYLKENMKKYGIEYEFGGFKEEIKRQKDKMDGNKDENEVNAEENDIAPDVQNDVASDVKNGENVASFLSDDSDIE